MSHFYALSPAHVTFMSLRLPNLLDICRMPYMKQETNTALVWRWELVVWAADNRGHPIGVIFHLTSAVRQRLRKVLRQCIDVGKRPIYTMSTPTSVYSTRLTFCFMKPGPCKTVC